MRTDGQTYGSTDGQRDTDMTKLIFAFHHFANAPEYLGKKVKLLNYRPEQAPRAPGG
jgi:hypothetical protein